MKSLKEDTFEVYLFLDDFGKENKEEFILRIIKKVPFIDEIKYAGVDSELLKDLLQRFIWDYNGEDQFFNVNPDEKNEILDIVKNSINELAPYSKSKKYIFVFPNYNKFVLDKMKGLNGFCSFKNVILIFLNKNGKDWKNALRETIYHEFAHSVSDFYKGGEFSIGDGLIFDGLAEHFREKNIGGDHAPYSIALSKEEIKKYFDKLKPDLNSMDWDLYMEVFFGSGKYPNWTGYSIGYYLVEQYLNKKFNGKEIDWNILLRENPKKILDEIISMQINF